MCYSFLLRAPVKLNFTLNRARFQWIFSALVSSEVLSDQKAEGQKSQIYVKKALGLNIISLHLNRGTVDGDPCTTKVVVECKKSCFQLLNSGELNVGQLFEDNGQVNSLSRTSYLFNKLLVSVYIKSPKSIIICLLTHKKASLSHNWKVAVRT